MDYDEVYFMHLTTGVAHNFQKALFVKVSPMHKKDPRYLFEKSKGQPQEF